MCGYFGGFRLNSYSDNAPARHRGVVAFPTQAGCCHQAFKEAPILLPQPLPATGAHLSRADQVRQAARAGNTQRAYLGHWNRFRSWAREQGLDLPEGLETALCDYLVHLAWEGRRMATMRQARTAISKGAQLAGWPSPDGLDGLDVAETMLGLGHILKGPQKRAAPLSAEALSAIRATALTRRRTRGGHTETAEYAQRRGLVDGPGLRHAGRAAAGLRGRRPALGGRGAGGERQRPHPDPGVEDRPGGRGNLSVPGTGCRSGPAGHPPRRGR